MTENNQRDEHGATDAPEDTTGHAYYEDSQPGFLGGDPTAPKTHHDEDDDDTTGHAYYEDSQPGFSGAVDRNDLPH